MREITEDEAYRLAEGAEEFPIIFKEEDDMTESAVCLKKFPMGYVLGVSCDTENIFKLFYSEEYEPILQKYQVYLNTMNEKGNPFADFGMPK